MEDKKFGDKMKELEVYNSLRIPEGEYFAVRVDGRSFSALTEKHFQKPADYQFLKIMDKVAETVMQDLDAVYTYTQSDEISFLIPATSQLFGRRAEKITTTAAGLASAVFSREFIECVVFDARIVSLPNQDTILDYFYWRAKDGFKNAVSTAAYWKLRAELGASAATTKLKSLGTNERQELLGGRAGYFGAIPGDDDQRSRFWFGTALSWSQYEKEGRNPITGETTRAIRRQIEKTPVNAFTRTNFTLIKSIT